MSHVLHRTLPWLVVFGLVGVVQFVVYLAYGARPLAALVGGVASGLVALLGAATYALVVKTQARRADAIISEAYATALRESEHEGLRRLHEDIVREQRRPLRPVCPLDDEPPER